MKISDFLDNVKNTKDEAIYYCCQHILSKKYDVKNDSIEESKLKEIFVDYENFTKLLNDTAGVIYRKYEVELNDIYKAICDMFNEDFDNEYLFNYRLIRVKNQEAKQFLEIEDKDTQETVIQKFEDKINIILSSKYYKNNEDKLSFEMVIPQKTLELIKSAVSLR